MQFRSGAGSALLDVVLIACVAMAGNALVATTWWFQDDWHFLANALGIAPRDAGLARIVSYEVYWRAFIGLFGTSSVGWAVTRLAIHFANALLVRSLVTKLTGRPATGLLVGLLFAASPSAFECLYWASGVVDLLGVLFALVAALLWWRRERRIGPEVIAAAIIAILCKETALAVIALMAAYVARSGRATRRDVVALCAILAATAVALSALQRDMAGSGDYELAFASIPRNLAVYGYWLIVPGPLMKSVAIHSSAAIVVGSAFWALWATVGVLLHRRGNPWPLSAGGVALLVLLPALLVGDHAVPRYVYAAAPAFLLAVVSSCGALSEATVPTRIAAAMIAAVFAWTTTAYHVDARSPSGKPMHRYVAKREIASMALRTINRQMPPGARNLALIVTPRAIKDEVSLLQDAIADDLAVRVIFGNDFEIHWVSNVEDADPNAVVFLVEGMVLRAMDGR